MKTLPLPFYGFSFSSTDKHQSSARSSSGRSGQRAPPVHQRPDSQASSRSVTPSKQVSLAASRKKPGNNGDNNFPEFNLKEYQESEERQLAELKKIELKKKDESKSDSVREKAAGTSSGTADTDPSSAMTSSANASGNETEHEAHAKTYLTEAVSEFQDYAEGGARPKTSSKKR